MYFLRAALNSIQKYNDKEEIDSATFLRMIREKIEIVGLDESSYVFITELRSGLLAGFPNSDISAPAIKVRPPPVTIKASAPLSLIPFSKHSIKPALTA